LRRTAFLSNLLKQEEPGQVDVKRIAPPDALFDFEEIWVLSEVNGDEGDVLPCWSKWSNKMINIGLSGNKLQDNLDQLKDCA
jgi:hypothetical protein